MVLYMPLAASRNRSALNVEKATWYVFIAGLEIVYLAYLYRYVVIAAPPIHADGKVIFVYTGVMRLPLCNFRPRLPEDDGGWSVLPFPPESGKTRGAGPHRQGSFGLCRYETSVLSRRQGALTAMAVIGLGADLGPGLARWPFSNHALKPAK